MYCVTASCSEQGGEQVDGGVGDINEPFLSPTTKYFNDPRVLEIVDDIVMAYFNTCTSTRAVDDSMPSFSLGLSLSPILCSKEPRQDRGCENIVRENWHTTGVDAGVGVAQIDDERLENITGNSGYATRIPRQKSYQMASSNDIYDSEITVSGFDMVCDE